MQKLKDIYSALTRTERFTFFVALVAILTSIFVIGGVAMNKFTKVVPASGGEYTEGVLDQPTFVNPILARSDADKNLVHLLFANLKDMSDKIDVDKNGRLWKVRLKENLLWSDGAKITTDDVIFTVQEIQDPETQSPLFSSWQGVIPSRSSELEMQFNLVSPYAFFEKNIESLYVLPKHLFADTPSANWRLSEYNLKPVGSGPYVFDNYEKRNDGFIVNYHLKTNPKYFATHPLVQNFNFNFFAKSDELINAFNTAAIDGFADFDPQSLENIKRSYQLFSFRLPSYYAVFLNQGQSLALREPAVREALNSAIDRNTILEKVFGGHGIALVDPIGGISLPRTFATSTDPVQILENAGWKVGSDGVRERKIKNTSVKLEFDLTVPQISFLVETANELRDEWQRIGAKANLIVLPLEETTDHVIKNREYQAMLFGNFLNPPSDLYPFWNSSERFYPGLNLALYNNKKADQLIDSIRQEFDAQNTEKTLADLREVVTNDTPALFLYSPDYLYVTTKDLKGVNGRPIDSPANRFNEVANWHLKTTRVFK